MEDNRLIPARPKFVDLTLSTQARCPACGGWVGIKTKQGCYTVKKNYCSECGQAIKWEENNEKD